MNSNISKSEEENKELFHKLFENREKLLKLLAPDGWEKSPFYLVAHPTSQQRYEYALRIHNNLKDLFKSKNKDRKDEPPKVEDYLEKDDIKKEVNPLKEFVTIFGLCIWDIFSDNNEVVASDSKIHDIGSFRGAGGFISEYINIYVSEILREVNLFERLDMKES